MTTMTDSRISKVSAPAFFHGDEIEFTNTIKNITHTSVALTRVMKNEGDFLALKSEWNELAAATDPDCVFLRHEWFEAAWSWLQDSCELNIVCVFQQQKLIGIVPLVLRQITYRRISISRLEFMAIPDTQQCDILADPANLSNVINALSQCLLNSESRWDILDLRYLSTDSPAKDLLAEAFTEQQLPHVFQSSGDNPLISLEGTWQAFYGERGRRLKKSNNLTANRLQKAGAIEIRRYEKTFESPEQRDQVLDAVIGISSRSWKEETGLSLENDGPGRFIRSITNHAITQGWLSIWVLYLDQKPVAMEYQLSFNGQIHALRADFDNAHRELSVGSYLNWKLLEQLFESGEKNYYMGPGDNAYKLRWTEKSRPLTRITAYNRTWRGHLINLIECKLRPQIKKILALRPVKKQIQEQE